MLFEFNARVDEDISGNYEGTEFCFYTEEDYLNCEFYVNDEEMELIKKNRDDVTGDMIKEVVLDLFRNKGK